jgi:cell division protein FtsQ
MASVRARRRRYHDDSYRREPPPKPRGTPRLAAIQLDGAFQAPKVTRKGAMLSLAGAALLLGVSVAGAAWIGGSLFDVREAATQAGDSAVASAGMRLKPAIITDWSGRRLDGSRAEEVRALVERAGGRSLMAADPQKLRAEIEALDWVARARVSRLWPATLQIRIERRREMARWQENGAVSVIDAAGERIFAARAVDHLDLPLVVGEGAGPAAAPVLAALERYPEVRSRARAFVRVGARRWDLKLKSGATIALPEANPSLALAALEGLHMRHDLLDRPVDRIDMRAPGRLAVRLNPTLAGGRADAAGHA